MKQLGATSFGFVLDRGLNLYSFFGMGRDCRKVHGIQSLLASIDPPILRGGKPLPPPSVPPGLKQDKLVIGGSVLLDTGGKVVMKHLSKHPYDRLSPEEILKCIPS